MTEIALLDWRPDDAVLVVGDPNALVTLGEPRQELGSRVVDELVRASGITAAIGGGAAAASGRWVQLTAESAQALRAYGPALKAGEMLPWVTGADGRIVQQLRFIAGGANPILLAGMVTSLATQYQLAQIERQLRDISAELGALRAASRILAESELAATLATLDRLAERVQRRQRLDDADWMALASCEGDVRRHHEQSSRHLGEVEQLVDDLNGNLAQRARAAQRLLQIPDLDFWLRFSVSAHLALTRWDRLYLLHEIETSPESADQVFAQVQEAAAERSAALARAGVQARCRPRPVGGDRPGPPGPHPVPEREATGEVPRPVDADRRCLCQPGADSPRGDAARQNRGRGARSWNGRSSGSATPSRPCALKCTT